MSRAFSIAPPPRKFAVSIAAIVLFLVVLAVVFWQIPYFSEPIPDGPLWLFRLSILLLAALAALFGYIAYAAPRVTFELSERSLHIRPALYGRILPLESLIATETARVDWRQQPDYRPRWRTNGIGLPGYHSGWFRLRNGEKALLFVTDRDRVVRVPTREGFSLLISPERPDVFVATLLEL